MVSYWCVFSNVFSNSYSTRIPSNTYCKISFLTKVYSQVTLQIFIISELLLTLIALAWFLTYVFFIISILWESLYIINASIWILACVYSQMSFKSSSYEKAFWHLWHWNRYAFLPNCIFFATNTLCLLESNINTLCLHLLTRLLKLSTSYSNVNNGTNAT